MNTDLFKTQSNAPMTAMLVGVGADGVLDRSDNVHGCLSGRKLLKAPPVKCRTTRCRRGVCCGMLAGARRFDKLGYHPTTDGMLGMAGDQTGGLTQEYTRGSAIRALPWPAACKGLPTV